MPRKKGDSSNIIDYEDGNGLLVLQIGKIEDKSVSPPDKYEFYNMPQCTGVIIQDATKYDYTVATDVTTIGGVPPKKVAVDLEES